MEATSSWLRSLPDQVSRCGRALVSGLLVRGPIPSHLGIIMDGNRRYAKREGLGGARQGHERGFDKLHQTLFWLLDLGVTHVSVYAFSIENFKRSKEEVAALMSLAVDKFALLLEDPEVMERYKVRIIVTGDLDLLPREVKDSALRLMRATQGHSRYTLNVCFAYTGCFDITQAVCAAGRRGIVGMGEVEAELLTAGMPPVDLVLRTSGERRLSDFLLWQSSAAQLAFIETLWPDLTFWDLVEVLVDYQSRALAHKHLAARLGAVKSACA